MRKELSCLRHDIRRLASTPRAWAVVILMLLYIENQFAPIRQMLTTENLTLSWPGMTVYFLSDAQVSMMVGLGLIMLLFDAPFLDETQRYIITRTGRGAWGRGQVLYVVCATILYTLFVAVALLAFQFPWTDWSSGWSSGINALAVEGYYEIYNTMLEYDPWLLDAYTPIVAMALVLALHMLAYVSLALIQFIVNVLGGRRLGFMAAAAPLIFDSIIEEFFDIPVYYYSPATLSRLQALDYGDLMGRPPLWYAFAALTTLSIACAVISVLMSKRKEIML